MNCVWKSSRPKLLALNSILGIPLCCSGNGYAYTITVNASRSTGCHSFTWGELSCSALPAAKRFSTISKWRMASNVRISVITVSIKNRIFCAKRQLYLIPLNRTAALSAALSNLTRPWSFTWCVHPTSNQQNSRSSEAMSLKAWDSLVYEEVHLPETPFFESV